MNSEDQSCADDPDEILAEVIGRLIDMHNRLGHELIAVQSVCAYLVAKQCVDAHDPLAAVHEAAALFSGTGVALADLSRNDSRYGNYDTRGATDAFERIGTMAEQNILSLFREAPRRQKHA